jgi:hypothetical protein
MTDTCPRIEPDPCPDCGARPGEDCPYTDLSPALTESHRAIGAVTPDAACDGGDVCESCQ